VLPTLIVQELQKLSILEQHNNNYIKLIKFINLLCDDCHKQVVLISGNNDDSNWCTPYRGKPNQHATCFPHSVHVWPSTICISHGPRIATFCKPLTNLNGSHCSREKGLPTQSTARRLTDLWVHTQFLSQVSQWSSMLKPSFCRWQGTRLTGPIN
jgi:hypothetical protein